MEELVEATFAEIRQLRATKGLEYAGEEDTLADFKEVAEQIGITSYQVWATYVKKHERAIDSFIAGGSVKSEAIESRIKDVITYHLLLLGLIADLEPKPLPTMEEQMDKLDICGQIGVVEQHHGPPITVECELQISHVSAGVQHYGRTPEGHGFGW